MVQTMPVLHKLIGSSEAGDESPVIHHFIKIFSVDALVRAAGVLLLPLYLVLMTQEAYATFNYLMSVIGVLAQVCTFGLYVPQSKLFHDVRERERSTLFLTICILLFGLLALTLLPTYIFGWDRTLIQFLFSGTIDYERYRYLIPAGVILAVCSQMTLNYFLTREQIGYVQRFNVLRLVLGGSFTIGALYWIVGDEANVRLSAALVAEFTALAALSLHYIREMHGSFSPVFARRALAMGLPIMGSAVLGIAINFGDKFFIEKYCSLADMSVYFLGLTFASVISVVFLAFNNVWLPGFLREKDLQKNLARTKRTFRNLLLVFCTLSILIWLAVAGAFQFGLINQMYIRVLSLLPVLLVGAICSSLVGLLSVYTVYWEMTYVTIFTGVAIAAISVPLNYFGAKDYGIAGIAGVSVILNLLYAGTYYGFIRYRVSVLVSRTN
jgi:O-antigen/teichoic acid export membrane protein